MTLKDRLILYRELNPTQWAKIISDETLKQDLLDFPEFSDMPLNQKAASIILGHIPKCECGNDLLFQGKRKETINGTVYGGWLEFCSSACVRNSPKLLEKKRANSIEKYGTPHWTQSNHKREEREQVWSEDKKASFKAKAIITYQEKYGVSHFSKTQEYLDKRTSTTLEQTNGLYTNHFQDTDKIKAVNNEKYGVDYYTQTIEGRSRLSENNGMKDPTIALKSKLNRILKSKKYGAELFDILMNKDSIPFKEFIDNIATLNEYVHRMQIANHLDISYSWLNNLFRQHDMNNDYLTLGTSTSFKEYEVLQYVESLGVSVKHGDRTILNGKEIDIVVEDKKLGIEFDGLRYHSIISGGKDKYYHLDKTELAEFKGYQLLHIFENEWDDIAKRTIWKSIIKSKLGLSDRRIFARKCILKSITPKDSREFFEKNHLSGFIGASIHLGLFYNDELVSAISYGKSRFAKNENEIYRFASLLDCQVIGALGKLLSKLPKENLVSYADRRISGLDSAYGKFFANRKSLPPTWWGTKVKLGELRHRLNFTKAKVKEMIGDLYDDTKTVQSNMFNNDIDIIYDCGNWKFYN